MRTEFKLVGLNRPFSMTCAPIGSEDVFWPKVGIPRERFDALWDYCKGNWKDPKIAVIEHDGLSEEGVPLNGVVVEVKEY